MRGRNSRAGYGLRRGNDSAPAGDTEHFGTEIDEAWPLHKEWARAQLNGLPDDTGAITEWIKLTPGQRPQPGGRIAAAISHVLASGDTIVT